MRLCWQENGPEAKAFATTAFQQGKFEVRSFPSRMHSHSPPPERPPNPTLPLGGT